MNQNDKNQSSGDYNNPKKELDEKSQKMSLSLHELAANNDIDQLTLKLLSPGQYVDKINDEMKTPLLVVARRNRGKSHFEVIEFLLNNGADPNARDFRDRTPLWHLIESGSNIEILRLFLKFNADFRCLNNQGSSLFYPAIRRNDYLDALKFLVQDVGFGVNYKEENTGMTPLHLAAYYNKDDSHYDVFKFLLEMGSDLYAQDSYGHTPLYYLIRSCNFRVFDLFLSHKAKFGVVKSIFYESGYIHGNNKNFEVLEKLFLLSNSEDPSMDVNYKLAHGFTALHSVARRFSSSSEPTNTKVFKCFLKNGANISAIDDVGHSPIMDAVSGMSHFIVKDEKKRTSFAEFLLEQSDFSKVVMNTELYTHIFGEPLKALENNVENVILKHLAKLTFLKIPVHPSFQKHIEDKTDYRDYFENCTKELEVMKNTKLKNSWISYFNLLVDDRKKLKNYAGNENLIEDFKNNNWGEKFPIYGDSLKRNVDKGLRRRELFDKSAVILSDCLPIFNTDDIHLIIRDILDCTLSKKDLSKFLCE